ncbi:hypothetical protein OHD62_16890 [Mesorhizobium sp. YC-39]|uniref:hypothetical protein n=1 Tax=unclassified Mesorhizobium TaxID=325217 RepID=UPI0021E9A4DC|nr:MULTISPECIES: hypothetical protein [unclassified Mesorhizobium]MCV3209519.1 hypothetical protein [Mesorhizobium sp. YC-2]MCV3230049.1 hypothetical protein [Mesorhizobium sp. YC-39]
MLDKPNFWMTPARAEPPSSRPAGSLKCKSCAILGSTGAAKMTRHRGKPAKPSKQCAKINQKQNLHKSWANTDLFMGILLKWIAVPMLVEG